MQELVELKGSLEQRVSERTTELRESQRQLQALSVRLTETEERDRHMMSDFLRDEIGTLLSICRLFLEPAPEGEENAVRDAAAARNLSPRSSRAPGTSPPRSVPRPSTGSGFLRRSRNSARSCGEEDQGEEA